MTIATQPHQATLSQGFDDHDVSDIIRPFKIRIVDYLGTGYQIDRSEDGSVRLEFLNRTKVTYTVYVERVEDAEAFSIFDFVLSVGRAIKDDEAQGTVGECFVDPEDYYEFLEQLVLEFKLPDPKSHASVNAIASVLCDDGEVKVVSIMLPLDRFLDQTMVLDDYHYFCGCDQDEKHDWRSEG